MAEDAASSHGHEFTVVDVVTRLPGLPYGYYRVLVEPLATIKYLAYDSENEARLTASAEVAKQFADFPNTGMPFPDIQGLHLGFTTVPTGDWNVGYLACHEESGKYAIVRTAQQKLASIEDVWHLKQVDKLELRQGQSSTEKEVQCQGQMYCGVFPGQLGHTEVVVSTEWYPDDIYGVRHETAVYAAIQGHNIGPEFLAHVTENQSRVIGYMVEKLRGQAAGSEDISACCDVLGRLHGLGIGYGDFRPGCFLRTERGIVMHGFGGAFWTSDQKRLDGEMSRLREWLQVEA
jgi:hypothetical protein